MSAAKKQDPPPSASTRPRSLFSWLLGTGRPLLVVLALVGLLVGGVSLAWRKLKPRILALPEYHVGLEQVEITPVPA